MTIATLERDYRLKVRLDECGDQITPGRYGHLYVDAGKLCLQALDGKLRHKSRWEEIGGKLWLGAISRNANGIGVQDAEVIGFDVAQIRAACRLIGVKTRRQPSEKQLAVLARIRPQAHAQRISQARTHQAGPGGIPGPEAPDEEE